MFELMLSFFKINMKMDDQEYYLNTEDGSCVGKCELIEPKGKYMSTEEEFTVLDSYGAPISG